MKLRSILFSTTFILLFILDCFTVEAKEEVMTVNAGFTSFIQQIDVEELPYDYYEVPEYEGFKSYMTYTLFHKRSNQYALQQICTTDSDGFRKVDDYYVIALGSYFDVEVGQRVDLVLANNEIIHCVIGDMKDDKDTDAAHLFTVANNCMSEFIIDPKALNTTVKVRGDASYMPTQSWNSPVTIVRVYDDNVLKS